MENNLNENLSRRNFLKTAAIAGGGTVAAVMLPNTAQAQERIWDATYDVIVVGSGFAGNAAAIEAKKNGAKNVILLEKMEVYGGNSCLNGGMMALPNTSAQQKKGIKDSIEIFVNDMMKAGRGKNHTQLCETIAKEGESAYKFLLECGVQWSDVLLRVGGHSVARTFISKNGVGGDIVVPLVNHGKKIGVTYRNRTMVKKIYRDESGVTGVQVIENYTFPDERSGRLRNYRALRGVIMATGGWSADPKLLAAQNPGLAGIETTNHKGATAEGLKAMLDVGALPILLDTYQLGPWTSPDEYGSQAAAIFCDYAFQSGMMIDKRTGKRFVNELADRKTRTDAQLGLRDTGTESPLYPVVFCPEKATKNEKGEPNFGFTRAFQEGSVKKFDSLESMAKALDINLKGLKEETAHWNAMVKKGKDEDFGKPLDKALELVPPFYAIRLWPKIHYCMGGVGISTKAEVTDFNTYKPIPGLYSAGEATGGAHGESRIGTTSSTDCIVFGRIAGINAAKRNV